MNYFKHAVYGFICLLFVNTHTLAADTSANQLQLGTEGSEKSSSDSKSWYDVDIVRYAWGSGLIRLQNPIGFDLESDGYKDERGRYGRVAFPMLSVSLENRITEVGQGKRIWSGLLDWQDYDGLELLNFIVGHGYALSPPTHRNFGFRIAGGVGAGVTRSSTFFDVSTHVTVEAWASVGFQLARFALDLTHRERKSIASTLDERSAAPRTRISAITVGLLF